MTCRIVTSVNLISCIECGQWWAPNEPQPMCQAKQPGRRKRTRAFNPDKFGERSRCGGVCALCGIGFLSQRGDGKPRLCEPCRLYGFEPYTRAQLDERDGPYVRGLKAARLT